MKQAILTEPGKIEIQELPVPEPADGEVVVKIDTALTCGTDLKAYIRGHNLIPMPGPFGHEYSGTIARVGKGVHGFEEGNQVMGVHSAPCLACTYCKKGLYNLCETIMNTKALGAFSEYILIPARVVRQNLFQKPKILSFEEAALLEPFSCVVHAYSNVKIDEIETALVIGGGPIGLMHLAYLKTKDIKVILSDHFDDRLALAAKMNADRVAVPHEVGEAIKVMTDGFGVDLVIECTGQQSVWEKSVNYVRRGGTVVLFGGCPAGTNVTYDAQRLHYDELTLVGSFHYTPEDVKNAYLVLLDRTMDLSLLISEQVPLEDIEKAFIQLKEGKGIKYALKP